MQLRENKTTQKRKKYKSSFLNNLYSILQSSEFKEIIKWNEEGTSFEITKPEEFVGFIVPNFFKHKNLNSFLKQINMYNFQRQNLVRNSMVFSHPLFQRDRKDLLKNIYRRPVNPGKSKHQDKEKELPMGGGAQMKKLDSEPEYQEKNLQKFIKSEEKLHNQQNFQSENTMKPPKGSNIAAPQQLYPGSHKDLLIFQQQLISRQSSYIQQMPLRQMNYVPSFTYYDLNPGCSTPIHPKTLYDPGYLARLAINQASIHTLLNRENMLAASTFHFK